MFSITDRATGLTLGKYCDEDGYEMSREYRFCKAIRLPFGYTLAVFTDDGIVTVIGLFSPE